MLPFGFMLEKDLKLLHIQIYLRDVDIYTNQVRAGIFINLFT